MKSFTFISRREFLAVSGGAAIAPALGLIGRQIAAASEVPNLLDHFILGCADLDKGIAFVEQRTGVRAAFGGVHPGRGTQNALLSLGERRYLEIMAPDPGQQVAPQIGNLRALQEPRIVGWAAHPGSLEQFEGKLRDAKIQYDEPHAGSRKRPDGKILHWKTLTLKDDDHGLLPFFIEWSADSIHPSVDAPKGCTLQEFTAESPEVQRVEEVVAVLGLDLKVSHAEKAALRASIVGPKGKLHVTS